MLVIHPDECIDCAVCEPECPVDAIIADTVDGAEKWVEFNQKYAGIWPNIPEKGEPPSDADEWAEKSEKMEHFSEQPAA